ncbi:MAG: HIT family protein [Clostridiales bacterium]|nr:HIT family protein [Clostridiales bacterium]
MDDNCIFCKLANGIIPTNSIYEDDDFNVILDASPASKGHALILPKQHYKNLYEIDPQVLAKAAQLAQRIVCHEKDVLGAAGYNVLQNNEPAAGQTVFHYHIHLIPRYAQEDGEILMWKNQSYSDEDMKDICNQMKM